MNPYSPFTVTKKILIISAFIFNMNCNAQLKIYKISVISDWNHPVRKYTVQNAIHSTNIFFYKYNIKFIMYDYMVSHAINNDYNLSHALDEFCNCNFKEIDITLLATSKHTGKNIGMAYLNAFKTINSKITIDLEEGETNENGLTLTHEILHLMGLGHSSIKNNIMCHLTKDKQITEKQETVIKKYQ